MPDSQPVVRVLARAYQPAAILAFAVAVLLCAVLVGQGAANDHIRAQAISAMAQPEQLAALDARIDARAHMIVDSPDRLALKTTMMDKHSEYERAIESLTRKTDQLEHSDSARELVLVKISSTLEQVQKDVQEIRVDQRAARGRVH
jgi:hypothetical protein